MKKSKFKLLCTLALSALVFVSCESDDDDDDNTPPANESELITDVELTFTDTEGVSSFTVTYSDPDGPGGNAPSVETITLPTGGALTAYTVTAKVLDASNPNDVEDITVEVRGEAEEHQFFYDPNTEAEAVVNIEYVISPEETDANGNPIGIRTIWVVEGTTSGAAEVRVILRHEPNKDAEGVAAGDITNAGGETDIDVIFPLVVE